MTTFYGCYVKTVNVCKIDLIYIDWDTMFALPAIKLVNMSDHLRPSWLINPYWQVKNHNCTNTLTHTQTWLTLPKSSQHGLHLTTDQSSFSRNTGIQQRGPINLWQRGSCCQLSLRSVTLPSGLMDFSFHLSDFCNKMYSVPGPPLCVSK